MVAMEKVQGGLTDAEKRDNVIRLAFGGSEEKFDEFLRVIREEIPPETSVVLRGSAVTGTRYKDGAPFDADGPGTSDLDLTLVGDAVIGLFTVTGFFVPGVHSRPLSDEDPDIAPELIPLRETLMAMTGRPVNIQASRDLVIQFRGHLLDQPYLTLIAKSDAPDAPAAVLQHPLRRCGPRIRARGRHQWSVPGYRHSSVSHQAGGGGTGGASYRHDPVGLATRTIARLHEPPAHRARGMAQAASVPACLPGDRPGRSEMVCVRGASQCRARRVDGATPRLRA